jgi:hypothetical protein
MDSIKTMVFPVELLHREFDGKLLLALTACERQWQVMLERGVDIFRRVILKGCSI